jgi:flavin reductase (DIM6/NTAB) family NADH-FMN oxidoreductase RutF
MWRRPGAGDFRELMGLAPAPVAVLTGRGGSGEPLGMTISTFVSISLEPPIALVSASRRSGTWARLAPAGRFAVNLLGDGQESLSRRFASPGPRFDGVAVESGPEGLPILAAACAAAEFAIFARHGAGDHELVLGELLSARIRCAEAPLLHHRSAYATVVPLAPLRHEAAA